MSEATPNPNTPRVEGELSLDDLSQIAGGTSSELDLAAGAGFDFGNNTPIVKQSDNMFDSQVDTSDYNVGASMNGSLMFP